MCCLPPALAGHVTTITALIGSAQALFSDPQPGKPGYGPGMEAIPASAVIDYPI